MRNLCTVLLLCVVAFFEFSCQKEVRPSSPTETAPKWESIGKPLGDSELNSITIHPQDDKLWFVSSWKGLYITRDGGKSWETRLSGYVSSVEIDPVKSSRIFAGAGNKIYMSLDYGKTWVSNYTFPKSIGSILVSQVDNAIYVGLRWEDSPTPNGIYKSNDLGTTWKYYSFGVSAKGLIPWDIEEDPVNKKIYVATEIYNHPTPYDPPFLISSDGGMTWEDISGSSLMWHAVKIQVQPKTQNVYVLLEGAGLYRSADFGTHWEKLGQPFGLEFIIDKNNPQQMYGGEFVYGRLNGGVFQSTDGGKSFTPKALEGHIVGSLCLNSNSTYLYVSSYKSGLYRIKIK